MLYIIVEEIKTFRRNNMKNKFAAVALVLMMIPALAFGLEPVEAVLEITGSLGTSGMAPYTPSVDLLSATNSGYSYYYGSYGSRQESIISNSSIDAYISLYMLNTEPLYLFAPYFRYSTVFTGTEVKEIPYEQFTSPNVYQDRKDVFDMTYTGIGVKRYFTDFNILPVNLYFGADLGYFSTLFVNPHSQILNYSDPSDKEGTKICKNSINRYTGGFFGFHLEGGIDYWISDSFGLTFKGGIRSGQGNIKGTVNSTDKHGDATPENGTVKEQHINQNGAYLSTGILVSFGRKVIKKSPEIIEQEPSPESLPAVSAIMDKGDSQYAAKDFKSALKSYDRVLFYMRNAQIYKKMANCLFYLDEKEDAIRLYELSLKMNPEDGALRAWLEGNR